MATQSGVPKLGCRNMETTYLFGASAAAAADAVAADATRPPKSDAV